MLANAKTRYLCLQIGLKKNEPHRLRHERGTEAEWKRRDWNYAFARVVSMFWLRWALIISTVDSNRLFVWMNTYTFTGYNLILVYKMCNNSSSISYWQLNRYVCVCEHTLDYNINRNQSIIILYHSHAAMLTDSNRAKRKRREKNMACQWQPLCNIEAVTL